jgi:DNA-binding NarL/FixJ family response regulator
VPSIRVLVAEDYEPFRRFVRSTLGKRPGLQVVGEVSDGLQAVHKAEELQPDLIVLDLGLPTLNGIEAARRIRKLAPDSKILFLSQESSVDTVQEVLGLGALGYVVKTHAGSELLPAIEAVLRGEQFVGNGLKGHEFSDGGGAPFPHGHEVLFFPNDAFLLGALTCIVAAALNEGNTAIVLATEPHRRSLFQGLEKLGLDVGNAIKGGTYIALDVGDALSTIMTSDMPDPVRFFGSISGIIKSAFKAAKAINPRVVVCGEGVAVLQAQGKRDAAIQLDRLCDELANTHGVDVLCVCPLAGVQSAET